MGKEFGVKRTATIVGKLLSKSNKERRDYLKSITPSQIKLLSEVCMNIIRGNVPITKRVKTILTRVKKTLHKLASRTVKSDDKKKLWLGIGGLHILNTLLPVLQHEILLSD